MKAKRQRRFSCNSGCYVRGPGLTHHGGMKWTGERTSPEGDLSTGLEQGVAVQGHQSGGGPFQSRETQLPETTELHAG